MTTLFAYGNINQPYSFSQIPPAFLTEKLRCPPLSHNAKVQRRYRCRWVAHFLLWELLKMASKPTALLQQIYYSQAGRPQLPEDEIDFNISHSGDWVAVILATKRAQSAVGIDIEFPEKNRNYTALLQYFASLDEQQWFQQQANSHSAFYRSWCLREAVLKSQGVGIVKLTEVQHQPNEKQIQSSYCPQGQLIFTDQLPFYLAFFVNHQRISETQCFRWNDEFLEKFELPPHCVYSVNATSNS